MTIREIVLDTETTGLDPKSGERITEVGCLELINHLPTGKTFHTYINPQREVGEGAVRISGLTNEFLKDKPLFMHIVDPFLEFIADSPLVIHNAPFDIGFLNAELNRLCRPLIPLNRAIDTLKMAKKKFPGAPATLDALCRRYSIDLSVRTKHGALLDSELLAKVYLELIGGRQITFTFNQETEVVVQDSETLSIKKGPTRPSRNFSPTPKELESHQTFIKDIKNPLWEQIKL